MNISVIADVYQKHKCFRPVDCSPQPMHPCERAFCLLLIIPSKVIGQAIGRFCIFSRFFFAIAKRYKAKPAASLSQVFTCSGDMSKILHNFLSVLNSHSSYKLQHHPECYNREKNTRGNTKSKRINDCPAGPTVDSDRVQITTAVLQLQKGLLWWGIVAFACIAVLWS